MSLSGFDQIHIYIYIHCKLQYTFIYVLYISHGCDVIMKVLRAGVIYGIST